MSQALRSNEPDVSGQNVHMEYMGYNGRIVIRDENLEIHRSGVAAKLAGLTSEKRRVFALADVSDVIYTPATRLMNGWLSIGFDGRRAGGTSRNCAMHPDTVNFRRRDDASFRALHDWLLHVVSVNRERGLIPADLAPAAPAPAPAAAQSPAAAGARAQGRQDDSRPEPVRRHVSSTVSNGPRLGEVKIVQAVAGQGAQRKLNKYTRAGWTVTSSAAGSYGVTVYTLTYTGHGQ
jgi:hypothetical protein